jgi:hypothetical protein
MTFGEMFAQTSAKGALTRAGRKTAFVRRKAGRLLETVLMGDLDPIGTLVVWLMRPIERLIRWRPRLRRRESNAR